MDKKPLEFLEKLLARLEPGSAILVAACGAGRYDGLLLEAGHQVMGVDQSGRMLARAREHFPAEQFPGLYYAKIGLQEMDFGDWEMRRYDTLPRADIDLWSADVWGFRIPGGESAAEMAARAWAAWEEWGAAESCDLVVVAHGGPLRVMAGRLLGLPQNDWLDIACPQGACIKLESAADGSWRRGETTK